MKSYASHYTDVHQLLGRAFVRLLLELASSEISTQPAGRATYYESKFQHGSLLLGYFPKNFTLQDDGRRCTGSNCLLSTSAVKEDCSDGRQDCESHCTLLLCFSTCPVRLPRRGPCLSEQFSAALWSPHSSIFAGRTCATPSTSC